MQTGWQQIGGYWYYLGSTENGKMVTDWMKIGDYWYYFGSDGKMKTGWQYYEGYWYYLRTATNVPVTGSQGGMLLSVTCTIGGTSYQFDGHGHCLNP
jgi:glucan-binding YG repeat protein